MDDNDTDLETLPPPKCRISDKRNAFAEHYWLTRNASKAARDAGYSARTARSQGSRLLTFVDVSSRIAELDAWHRERLVWDKDRAIEQLMADHALYRLDPKSAGAATRSLELILRLEGLLDEKGKGADDGKGSLDDWAETLMNGALEFDEGPDGSDRTLN